MAPWELLHAAEALNSKALNPAAQAAQERCRQLSMQLGSASKERQLHGLLPSSAVSAFMAANGSSEAAQAQQVAALKQVHCLPVFCRVTCVIIHSLMKPLRCCTPPDTAWEQGILPAESCIVPMQSSGLLSLPCSMSATSDLTEADRQSPLRLPGAQVISAGVQEGDLGHAVDQLHQAAAVAARHSLSTWGLSMHFVEALLTMPVSLEGTDEALKVHPVFLCPHLCITDSHLHMSDGGRCSRCSPH